MIIKTLLLPDIHHKVDLADKIIKYVDADVVICIGDLYDNFSDTPEMVSHSSEWLNDFVKNPNHIFIYGNHDIPYRYPYTTLRCSGYEQWKSFIINDIVTKDTWDKLKWYHILDNKWLLTHAGLHDYHLPEEIRKLSGIEQLAAIGKYIDSSIIDGLRDAANNKLSWILNAGYSRGGRQRYGGITWNDHNREHCPIIGLNQLYGHSPQQNPNWLIQDTLKSKPYFNVADKYVKIEFDINKSFNLCLDTHLHHYAIWDGEKLSVHWIGDI